MMARNITSDQENEDRRERERVRVCTWETSLRISETLVLRSTTVPVAPAPTSRMTLDSAISVTTTAPLWTRWWCSLQRQCHGCCWIRCHQRQPEKNLLLSPSLSLFWSPALSSLAPSLRTYPKDPSENPVDPWAQQTLVLMSSSSSQNILSCWLQSQEIPGSLLWTSLHRFCDHNSFSTAVMITVISQL